MNEEKFDGFWQNWFVYVLGLLPKYQEEFQKPF